MKTTMQEVKDFKIAFKKRLTEHEKRWKTAFEHPKADFDVDEEFSYDHDEVVDALWVIEKTAGKIDRLYSRLQKLDRKSPLEGLAKENPKIMVTKKMKEKAAKELEKKLDPYRRKSRLRQVTKMGNAIKRVFEKK